MPLVHIAQPLFQPHHRLAVAREAEVAGLDDAGVHGADRDLMQRRALRGMEDVGRAGRGCRLRPPQRRAHTPAAVVEPGPRIGRALRLEPVEIADGALQAQSRRMRLRHRWEPPARTGQADRQHIPARLVEEAQVHRLAVAPQARERRFPRGDPDHRLPPRLFRDDDARPRPLPRDAPAIVGKGCEERHGATSAHPVLFAKREYPGPRAPRSSSCPWARLSASLRARDDSLQGNFVVISITPATARQSGTTQPAAPADRRPPSPPGRGAQTAAHRTP